MRFPSLAELNMGQIDALSAVDLKFPPKTGQRAKVDSLNIHD